MSRPQNKTNDQSKDATKMSLLSHQIAKSHSILYALQLQLQRFDQMKTNHKGIFKSSTGFCKKKKHKSKTPTSYMDSN